MAAVDSELTLMNAGPYQKIGWLPNPFNFEFNRLPFIREVRAHTVMVGRLDGPTPAIARRLVDDALAVEKTGLTGVFYIDARGLAGKPEVGSYTWYDQHLLRLYDLVKKYSDLKVVLDKKPGGLSAGFLSRCGPLLRLVFRGQIRARLQMAERRGGLPCGQL